MGLATPLNIAVTGTTDKINYDILNDNLQLRARLLKIFPDFQTSGLECCCSVFLETTASCQCKINTVSKDGEFNDFIANTVYSMGENSLVKNVILSAQNVKYTIRISF